MDHLEAGQPLVEEAEEREARSHAEAPHQYRAEQQAGGEHAPVPRRQRADQRQSEHHHAAIELVAFLLAGAAGCSKDREHRHIIGPRGLGQRAALRVVRLGNKLQGRYDEKGAQERREHGRQ